MGCSGIWRTRATRGGRTSRRGWTGPRTCRSRCRWSTDVIDDDHEYLFWVGCAGAFEDSARKTTRAVAELLHLAAVGLRGAGHRARPAPGTRPGGPATSSCSRCSPQQNVETINAAFGDRPQPQDRGHLRALLQHAGQRVPAPGRRYEVVHHTQLLNRLVRDKRLVRQLDPARPAGVPAADAPTVTPAMVTYHDPCYLGPAQPDLLPAAGADRGLGGDTDRDAAEFGAGHVLRRRRRPDVDGGEDRQAASTWSASTRHWTPEPKRSSPAARSAGSCSPTGSPTGRTNPPIRAAPDLAAVASRSSTSPRSCWPA